MFRHITPASMALILAACAFGTRVPDDENLIQARVHQLLLYYAADNQSAVIAMIDPSRFTLYGSDVKEIVHTPEELRRLMSDDFALWGSAAFGELRDMDIRVDGQYASAFFHVPFSAGGRAPVLVRMSTVWHRRDGAWYLTQSSSTVPTVGSSAAELLKR